MLKILKILVISYFFLIIFSFSHLFYLFWFNIVLDFFWRGGYEWIKSGIVSVYWILFWIWTLFFLHRYKLYKNDYKILRGIWIIVFWMVVSTILSISIFGSVIWLSEKYHWLLYFLSLVTFFSSLYFWFDKWEYKKILNYVFVFSIFSYLYAFIQFLWLDPLANFYETRVSLTRATAFLWNANYLAWYVLILLSLSKFIDKKILRRWFILISYLVLLITGSYFWIFLWIIYFLYSIYSFNKKIFVFSLVSFVVLLAFIVNSIWIEKQWSLLARPYIWKTSVIAIINTPKTILFWYWPDTLQLVFDKYKLPELLVYETENYTADRTHNIFLDFIYFFWIFWGWFIIYFIFKWYRLSKNKDIKLSILLFVLFFSFNIAVSIHFIFILFLLSWIYNKNLK